MRIDGVVTTAADQPVAGAEVTLRTMSDGPAVGGDITCFGYIFDEVVNKRTDSTGGFYALLQGLNIVEPPDCVEVAVTPPPSTGLQATVDTFVVAYSYDKESAPHNELRLVVH